MKLFETKIEIREDFHKPDQSEYRIVRSKFLFGIRTSQRFLDIRVLKELGRIDWDSMDMVRQNSDTRYVLKTIEDCMPYIEMLQIANKKPIYHPILCLE